MSVDGVTAADRDSEVRQHHSIDIDLENGVSDHYDEMVAAIHAAAKSNGDSRKYWVTGAPQCAMPEPHLERCVRLIQT